MIRLDIKGTIDEIKFSPALTRTNIRSYNQIENGIQDSVFLLNTSNSETFAISKWLSPKRTRSYPYSRVYDTLGVSCDKRIAIIPVIKDEGSDGDRDFLQYDTISLMTLLGVYVILAFYDEADSNPKYRNKITNQKLNLSGINHQLEELQNHSGGVVNWNQYAHQNFYDTAYHALSAYEQIASHTGIQMHSIDTAHRRVDLMLDPNKLKDKSRSLAEEAQARESVTLQPGEQVRAGVKGTLLL